MGSAAFSLHCQKLEPHSQAIARNLEQVLKSPRVLECEPSNKATSFLLGPAGRGYLSILEGAQRQQPTLIRVFFCILCTPRYPFERLSPETTSQTIEGA